MNDFEDGFIDTKDESEDDFNNDSAMDDRVDELNLIWRRISRRIPRMILLTMTTIWVIFTSIEPWLENAAMSLALMPEFNNFLQM